MAGASLTIQNCTVRMPHNGRLLVNRGAVLQVVNATLTNYCDFWQGIEVRGNGSQPQPTKALVIANLPHSITAQGVVYLSNATIENAFDGITTSKYEDYTNSNFHGGIILAFNTHFINCKKSVELLPYDFPDASGAYNTNDDNICEFNTCSFEVNDAYFPQYTFDYFATLWDVDGVDFEGCTFTNARTLPVALGTNGKGIFSQDATYYVKSIICTGPPYAAGCGAGVVQAQSSFAHLYRGIEAYQTIPHSVSMQINKVNFTDNERAVLLSGISAPVVISNTFAVPDFAEITCYGLYLESSTGYHVEDNSFSTYGAIYSGAGANSGLFVANNSPAAEEIYRNHFTHIEIGIRCQNNNGGLQLKCNDFTNPMPKQNIIITSGNFPPQGTCAADAASPAGNAFSHTCSGSFDDFKVQSGISAFTYRHHDEALSGAAYKPACYSTSKITLQKCSGLAYNAVTSCPSKLPAAGDIGGRLLSDELVYQNTIDLYQSIIDNLNSKIDGGNTEAFIADISGGSISATEIADASPYISNGALGAIVSTPDVLATTDLLDVLADNAPVTDSIAALLDAGTYAISPEAVNALSQDVITDADGILIVITSPMQDLTDDIAYMQSEKEMAQKQLLQVYMDSMRTDTALTLLADVDANWARMREVELLYTTGRNTEASSALLQVAGADSVSDAFILYYSTLISLQSASVNLEDMDSSGEANIRMVAGKQTAAGIQADNVLRLALEEDHPEIIDPITDDAILERLMIAEEKPSIFKIYPNPAADVLFIEVNADNYRNDNYINIYDVTGKLVGSEKLRSDMAMSWIDISKLNSGIYVIECVSKNTSLYTTKLIVD